MIYYREYTHLTLCYDKPFPYYSPFNKCWPLISLFRKAKIFFHDWHNDNIGYNFVPLWYNYNNSYIIVVIIVICMNRTRSSSIIVVMATSNAFVPASINMHNCFWPCPSWVTLQIRAVSLFFELMRIIPSLGRMALGGTKTLLCQLCVGRVCLLKPRMILG